MKKILFVTNLFPPNQIGGYEIACYDTYKLLDTNKFECIVLTSDYSINNDSSIVDDKNVYRNLKLHTDFKDDTNCLNYLDAEKHNCAVLREFCEKYKPDYIYFWNIWGIGSNIVKITDPSKSVYHVMDLSLFNYDFNIINYIRFRILKNKIRPINIKKHINNFIFISEYVTKFFNDFDYKNGKIIYPFLKNFENYKYKKNYKNKTIYKGVYLGQIEKHKGLVDLCININEVNSYYGYNILQLDIYGNSLSGLDKELISNFNSFIRIINNKSRDYILNRLATYDVGFFPSIWEEPFGIAQIELMAAALPVMSTGRGGSKEALTNKNSILYHDTDSFREGLINLLDNYDVHGPILGEFARNSVQENFTSQLYVQNIVKFINKLY